MKIIENCWSKVHPFDCQYGAHLFDGITASIYINHWLAVSSDLWSHFSRKNEEGFVGHCLLVFRGVKKFDFVVTPYDRQGEEIIWHEPVSFNYSGSSLGETTLFYCEGSLHGFPSSVGITVDAEKFELQILEKDEPAREGQIVGAKGVEALVDTRNFLTTFLGQEQMSRPNVQTT